MKRFLTIISVIIVLAVIVVVLAQTENKYVFTAFEEKLSKAELNFDIFQSPKFLDLKFFADLPVKAEASKKDNPFNY